MTDKKTRHFFFNLLSWLVIISQVTTSLVYADTKSLNKPQTLAPPSIFQTASPTEESKAFKESVLSDVKLLTVSFSIAAHFLVDNRDKTTLAKTIRDEFRNNPDFLEGIDLKEVYSKDDIVHILYKRKNTVYEIKICPRDKFKSADKAGSEWGISEKFAIEVAEAVALPAESEKQDRLAHQCVAPAVQQYRLVAENERSKINKERIYWDVFDNEILPKLRAARKADKKAVLTMSITGSAASGKTLVAESLKRRLSREFNNVNLIFFDDWLLESQDRPLDPETGKTSEDVFQKFEVSKFIKSMKAFIKGQGMLKPIYSQTAKGRLKMALDEKGRVSLLLGPARKLVVVDTARGVEFSVQDASGKVLETGREVSLFGIPFKIEEAQNKTASGEFVLKVFDTRIRIGEVDVKAGRTVHLIDENGARAKDMLDSDTGKLIAESGTLLTKNGYIDMSGNYVNKPWDVKEYIPHKGGVFIIEGILTLYDYPGTKKGERLPELYTTSLFLDTNYEVRLERGLSREKSRAEKRGKPMPSDEVKKYIGKFTERKEKLEDPFIYVTRKYAEFTATTATRAEGLFNLYRDGKLLSDEFKPVIEAMNLNPKELNEELDRIERDYILNLLRRSTVNKELRFERKVKGLNYNVYFLADGLVIVVKVPNARKDIANIDALKSKVGDIMVPGTIIDLSQLDIKIEGLQPGKVLIQNAVIPFDVLLSKANEPEDARDLLRRFIELQKEMWRLGIVDKKPRFDRYGSMITSEGRPELLLFAVDDIADDIGDLDRDRLKALSDDITDPDLKDYFRQELGKLFTFMKKENFGLSVADAKMLPRLYHPEISSLQIDYTVSAVLDYKTVQLWRLFKTIDIPEGVPPEVVWTKLWLESIARYTEARDVLEAFYRELLARPNMISGFKPHELRDHIIKLSPSLSRQDKNQIDKFVNYLSRIPLQMVSIGEGEVRSTLRIKKEAYDQMDPQDKEDMYKLLSNPAPDKLAEMIKASKGRINVACHEAKILAEEGRTIYMFLRKPIKIGEKYLKVLRFKGARPLVGPDGMSVKDYKGAGSSSYIMESYNSGAIIVNPGGNYPWGTMLYSWAWREYELMERFNGTKCDTDIAIGTGRYRKISYKNQAVGYVICGIEDDSDYRFKFSISDRGQIEGGTLFMEDFVSGSATDIKDRIKKLYEDLGESFRYFHDEGYTHRWPHLRNIGLRHDRPKKALKIVLRDLNNSQYMANNSLPERVADRFLDIERIIYEVISPWDYYLDYDGLWEVDSTSFPELAESFLKGYFPELDPNSGEFKALLEEATKSDFVRRIDRLATKPASGSLDYEELNENNPYFGKLVARLRRIEESRSNPEKLQGSAKKPVMEEGKPDWQKALDAISPKMVVFDLDDTLSEIYGEVSDSICRKIEKLLERGIKVVVVTGARWKGRVYKGEMAPTLEKRLWAKIRPELRRNLLILSDNGRLWGFKPSGEPSLLKSFRLSPKVRRTVHRIIKNVLRERKMDLVTHILDKEGGMSIHLHPANVKKMTKSLQSLAEEINRRIKDSNLPLWTFTSTAIEITRISKSDAVKMARDHFRLEKDCDILVFGDSMHKMGNDLPMAQIAGTTGIYVGKKDIELPENVYRAPRAGPEGSDIVLAYLVKDADTSIEGLVDRLVELRNKAQALRTKLDVDDYHIFTEIPLGTSLSEEEKTGRRELIRLAITEYDILLQILHGLGFLRGDVLYPAIGGDELPARYARIIGIEKSDVQRLGEYHAKKRMSDILGIADDSFSARRIKADLDTEAGRKAVIERLKSQGGHISTVILKGISNYISKNSVTDFFDKLNEYLTIGDCIILFDKEKQYESVLRDLGFEKAGLPIGVEKGIADSPRVLKSYLEPSYEEEDEDLLFNFSHSFTIMRKVKNKTVSEVDTPQGDYYKNEEAITDDVLKTDVVARAEACIKRGDITPAQYDLMAMNSYGITRVIAQLNDQKGLAQDLTEDITRFQDFGARSQVINPEVMDTILRNPEIIAVLSGLKQAVITDLGNPSQKRLEDLKYLLWALKHRRGETVRIMTLPDGKFYVYNEEYLRYVTPAKEARVAITQAGLEILILRSVSQRKEIYYKLSQSPINPVVLNLAQQIFESSFYRGARFKPSKKLNIGPIFMATFKRPVALRRALEKQTQNLVEFGHAHIPIVICSNVNPRDLATNMSDGEAKFLKGIYKIMDPKSMTWSELDRLTIEGYRRRGFQIYYIDWDMRDKIVEQISEHLRDLFIRYKKSAHLPDPTYEALFREVADEGGNISLERIKAILGYCLASNISGIRNFVLALGQGQRMVSVDDDALPIARVVRRQHLGQILAQREKKMRALKARMYQELSQAAGLSVKDEFSLARLFKAAPSLPREQRQAVETIIDKYYAYSENGSTGLVPLALGQIVDGDVEHRVRFDDILHRNLPKFIVAAEDAVLQNMDDSQSYQFDLISIDYLRILDETLGAPVNSPYAGRIFEQDLRGIAGSLHPRPATLKERKIGVATTHFNGDRDMSGISLLKDYIYGGARPLDLQRCMDKVIHIETHGFVNPNSQFCYNTTSVDNSEFTVPTIGELYRIEEPYYGYLVRAIVGTLLAWSKTVGGHERIPGGTRPNVPHQILNEEAATVAWDEYDKGIAATERKFGDSKNYVARMRYLGGQFVQIGKNYSLTPKARERLTSLHREMAKYINAISGHLLKAKDNREISNIEQTIAELMVEFVSSESSKRKINNNETIYPMNSCYAMEVAQDGQIILYPIEVREVLEGLQKERKTSFIVNEDKPINPGINITQVNSGEPIVLSNGVEIIIYVRGPPGSTLYVAGTSKTSLEEFLIKVEKIIRNQMVKDGQTLLIWPDFLESFKNLAKDVMPPAVSSSNQTPDNSPSRYSSSGEGSLQLSASLLSISDPAQFGRKAVEAIKAGADFIHYDYIEGKQGKNSVLEEGSTDNTATFTPARLKEIKDIAKREGVDVPIDVHIVGVEPSERLIKSFIDAGADIICIHWEAFANKKELLKKLKFIKKHGAKAGIVLRPDADISRVGKFITGEAAKYIDMISQGGIYPCYDGQVFIYSVLKNIRALREDFKFKGVLAIDGGVETEISSKKAIEAGADFIVAGSAFFGDGRRTPGAMAIAAKALRDTSPIPCVVSDAKPADPGQIVKVLECTSCHKQFGLRTRVTRCPVCGGDIQFEIKGNVDFKGSIVQGDHSMWRYRKLLPVDEKFIVSAGEGNTGVIYLEDLSKELGVELYAKPESENPTGTFKDREASFVISRSLELGQDNVVMQSTGNTGVAITYYAGLAGMHSYFFCPELSRYKMLLPDKKDGNSIILVDGDPSDVKAAATDFALVHNFPKVSPFYERCEANVTQGYEIAEEILDGNIPNFDFYVQTVAAGMGPIGFFYGMERVNKWTKGAVKIPRVVAVQISEFAPVQEAWDADKEQVGPKGLTPKFASAHPFEPTLHTTNAPAYYPFLRRLLKGTNGVLTKVEPKAVKSREQEFRKSLRRHGVELTTTENSSFVGYTGLIQQIENGTIPKGSKVILMVTGKGKKKYIEAQPDAVIPPAYDPAKLLEELERKQSDKGIDEGLLEKAKSGIRDYLIRQYAADHINEEMYQNDMATVYKNLEFWVRDPDIHRISPNIRPAIFKAVKKGRWKDIVEAFRQDVTFGTGGIRGMMALLKEELELLAKDGPGAEILKGPNTINDIVLLLKTAGVIKYAKEHKLHKVVIGYDSRIAGRQFAEMVAQSFIANSTEGYPFTVYLFDAVNPFPELSLAVTAKEIAADLGILISASHSSSNYNGYKITDYAGAQLSSDMRQEVVKCIRTAGTTDIRLKPLEEARPGELVWLGGDKPVVDMDYKGVDLSKYFINMHSIYARQVKKFIVDEETVKRFAPQVKIGYAAFNGAGNFLVPELLRELRFTDTKVVRSLQELNGMFPAFGWGEQPDPGEPAAAGIAVSEFIKEHGQKAFDELDILISTDPDADRAAIIVKVPQPQQKRFGRYMLLSANDAWTLLLWYRLERAKELNGGILPDAHRKYISSTHVTTDALERLAWNLFGVRSLGNMLDENGKETGGYLNGRRTWVGFSSLAESCRNIRKDGLINVGAFEESNGFSIFGGPVEEGEVLAKDGHVNDKDGVFAVLLLAEVAAYAKSKGTTLFELLDDIYLKPQVGYLAVTNKPALPRVGSFEGDEGIGKKIRLLKQAQIWMNKANERAGKGNPFILAGQPVIGAVEFKTGRYDTQHYEGFPNEGIRFFFPDRDLRPEEPFWNSKNFITIRPSGTAQSIRFYTQLFAYDLNKDNIGELKDETLKRAQAITLEAQAELLAAAGYIEKTRPPKGMTRDEKVASLGGFRNRKDKITMLTSYDPRMARALRNILDFMLVGDSVSNVRYGFEGTEDATMDMMIKHTRLVWEGAHDSKAIIVGDMPAKSYDTVEKAVYNAKRLRAAGADVIKLEGGAEVAEIVKALVKEGIPVMGHIGYTPQSALVGVYGGTDLKAAKLLEDALALEDAGAFAIVLEMVYDETAKLISDALEIPTIGIGSGIYCDGQVLVGPDALGLTPYRRKGVEGWNLKRLKKRPRFAQEFIDPTELRYPEGVDIRPDVKPKVSTKAITDAGRNFVNAVRQGNYPMSWHSRQLLRKPLARYLPEHPTREDYRKAISDVRRDKEIAVAVMCYPALPIKPYSATGTEKIYSSLSFKRPVKIVIPSNEFSLAEAVRATPQSILGMRALNSYGNSIISVKTVSGFLQIGNNRNYVRIPLGKKSGKKSDNKLDIERLANYENLEVQDIHIREGVTVEDRTSQNYHLLYLLEGQARVLSADGLEVLGELNAANPFIMITAQASDYKIKATQKSRIIKSFVPFVGVESLSTVIKSPRKARIQEAPDAKIRKVEAEMRMIHDLDMEISAPLEKNKTLWLVIPRSLIPQSPDYNQQTKFNEFARRLARRYPGVREKIRVVTDKQLIKVVSGLVSDEDNIVCVALDNEDYIDRLPDSVKMLVFKPHLGELGDFRQMEGIITALRALHSKEYSKLLKIYELLTGTPAKELPYWMNNKDFARNFVFTLPPIVIHDEKELKRLNENLLLLIEAA